MTYALNHFFGRVKVNNVEPEIYTVEIANIVDDYEKFKTISQLENALTFVKTCRKENVEFIKTKVGNKQGLAVRGLDRLVLNKLRVHALKLKYVKNLEFVSRFNMFEMFLPDQKEKLLDIIKEQYPNVKYL